MIVVDTNVVAHLLLRGEEHSLAQDAFRREPLWAAPLLWRSEFRHVLVKNMRQQRLSLANALTAQSYAEELFKGREYPVHSRDVLNAAATSGCSGYDCEFVVLARMLGTPLITADHQVLAAFPDVAMDLRTFATSGTG